MKIKIRKYSDCVPKFNSSLSTKLVVFSTSSPVDLFYKEGSCDSKGKPIFGFTNPLQVLLNQKRIENIGTMGVESIRQWLMSSNSSSINELRKNCSDEDLAFLIKDKNLQSPSEIHAWSKYMESHMDKFKADIQSVVESLHKLNKPEAYKPDVEPLNSN